MRTPRRSSRGEIPVSTRSESHPSATAPAMSVSSRSPIIRAACRRPPARGPRAGSARSACRPPRRAPRWSSRRRPAARRRPASVPAVGGERRVGVRRDQGHAPPATSSDGPPELRVVDRRGRTPPPPHPPSPGRPRARRSRRSVSARRTPPPPITKASGTPRSASRAAVVSAEVSTSSGTAVDPDGAEPGRHGRRGPRRVVRDEGDAFAHRSEARPPPRRRPGRARSPGTARRRDRTGTRRTARPASGVQTAQELLVVLDARPQRGRELRVGASAFRLARALARQGEREPCVVVARVAAGRPSRTPGGRGAIGRSGRAPVRGPRGSTPCRARAASPCRAASRPDAGVRPGASRGRARTGRTRSRCGCDCYTRWVPRLFPFVGLVFDDAVSGPLDRVTAPPYDVISDARRRELPGARARSASCTSTSPRAATTPRRPTRRYARAAHLLEDWEARGALRRSDAPRLYFAYEMAFPLQGVAAHDPRAVRRDGARALGRRA